MKDDPIYEWYEARRREARRLEDELDEAHGRGAPIEEIRRLRERLERARYVGD